MPHGQFVVMAFVSYIQQVQPMVQELLNQVMQAHECVDSRPDILANELAFVVLFFCSGAIQIEQTSRFQAVPNLLEKWLVLGDVLDHPEDERGE